MYTRASKPWTAGTPVQDLQRLPKKGLKMYMRSPKFATGAKSDAYTLAGSEQCAAAGDSQKLAEMCEPKASELTNRPGVGLSEWAGTMQGFLANLKESNGRLDLTGLMQTAEKHDLSSHLAALNNQDFNASSDSDKALALKKCLQFAQDVEDEFEAFHEIWLRLQNAYLGTFWALELAALASNPEVWIRHLRAAPKIDQGLLKEAAEEPQRMSRLLALLQSQLSPSGSGGSGAAKEKREKKVAWTPEAKKHKKAQPLEEEASDAGEAEPISKKKKRAMYSEDEEPELPVKKAKTMKPRRLAISEDEEEEMKAKGSKPKKAKDIEEEKEMKAKGSKAKKAKDSEEEEETFKAKGSKAKKAKDSEGEEEETFKAKGSKTKKVEDIDGEEEDTAKPKRSKAKKVKA